MTNDDVAKDGIAFAIAYADNCQIPEGYANAKSYEDQDWMSDWAAYLADAVWDELRSRGFKITRPVVSEGGPPPWAADYGTLIHAMQCPGAGACTCASLEGL